MTNAEALLFHRPLTRFVDRVQVHTTIVLPSYNEEQALPHVLRSIFAVIDAGYEVLVVDDGSSDQTSKVAAGFPCRVLVHKENRGKGAAMMTGVRAARGENVIFIDADATYPADVIPQIVENLARFDMVRCVRHIGRQNIPWINRVGNNLFDLMIRSVHHIEGDDVLSGLYGLKRSMLLAMRLEASRFDIESEIVIKGRAQGLSTKTLPINYQERIGDKKLNPVRDGISILSRIIAMALRHSPFILYVVPGVILWLVGMVMLGVIGAGWIFPSVARAQTMTLVIGTMAMLSGFQLIVHGCIVNLYVAEAHLRQPSQALRRMGVRFPRKAGAVAGALLTGLSLLVSLSLVTQWMLSGMGTFVAIDALVISLALAIWGIQLVSAMAFLSLFAASARQEDMARGQVVEVEELAQVAIVQEDLARNQLLEFEDLATASTVEVFA